MLDRYYNLRKVTDAEYRIISDDFIPASFEDFCVDFFTDELEMEGVHKHCAEYYRDCETDIIPEEVKKYIKSKYGFEFYEVDGVFDYKDATIFVVTEMRNVAHGHYERYYHYIFNRDDGLWVKNNALSKKDLFELLEQQYSDAIILSTIHDIVEGWDVKKHGSLEERDKLIMQYHQDLFFPRYGKDASYYARQDDWDRYYWPVRYFDEYLIERSIKKYGDKNSNESKPLPQEKPLSRPVGFSIRNKQ